MGQFWEPLGTIMEGQRVALEAQIIAELSLSLNWVSYGVILGIISEGLGTSMKRSNLEDYGSIFFACHIFSLS